MSKTVKRSTLLVLSVLFATGLMTAIPDYAERYWEEEVSLGMSRLTLMEIHGFFAMAALFLFGVIYNSHVVRRIKRPKKRRSGLGMVIGMAILPLTGGLLYYAGNETVRSWSSWLHTGFGVLVFGMAIWHFRKKVDADGHWHLRRNHRGKLKVSHTEAADD
ncbi:MAG: hypothetical protein H6510_02450 [Acidobacteria bacterium]|nr:hypothetical protein [Acidobacteriota bacterium]MCB9396655.1 hypothetical protein [Acidobacteriota bacterium]